MTRKKGQKNENENELEELTLQVYFVTFQHYYYHDYYYNIIIIISYLIIN